jgi:diguanylate cyclase (GGDEF)-like protein
MERDGLAAPGLPTRGPSERDEAETDALTGVADRGTLKELLAAQTSDPDAPRCSAALLVIDLERFERVNEALGHDAGDEILRITGERLAALEADGEMVARVTGLEFALFVPTLSSHEQAVERALAVLEAVRAPFGIGGLEVFVSCRVGIALYPDDGVGDADLLTKAHSAVESLRRRREDGFSFPPMTQVQVATTGDLVLEAALRRSIERDELVLHFQPQAHTESGAIVGAEALVRWDHPQHGLLLPPAFIGLAEQSGFIRDIDRWMIRAGCTQAATWASEGLNVPLMSVNISTRNLTDDSLVDAVADAVQEAAIAPHQLELEFTEDDLVRVGHDDLTALQSFRDLGVRVALDNFGGGRTSLLMLRDVSFDTIKIDRALIAGLGGGGEESAEDPEENSQKTSARGIDLVTMVTSLAGELGMRVVVQGVESTVQRSILREVGCEVMQGYLYGRPGPAHDLAAILELNLLPSIA